MYYAIINNPNELYHHGRLGQKWGERNGPPYPLSRGQLSLGGYIQKRKAKKAAETEQKKEVAQKQAEEAKRRHDADKEKVLRSGSASEVLKYQGELTNQELQNAVNRINLESQLRNYSAKEIKRNMDKINQIMKDVETLTGWTKIATDTYNTMARIYNATEEGKKNPWTLVDTGGGGGKKKNKNKDGGD